MDKVSDSSVNIFNEEKMAADALLANAAIVLVEPKFAENVGAAARSAMNMGISRLIVINDRMPDKDVASRMATHHAAHLIESLELYDSLEKGLAGFSWVVGSTARTGRLRRQVLTPGRMVGEIVPLLHKNRIAFLFGREDRGLTNDELRFCNMLVTIPTAQFSSLNLAQAVAIVCYELRCGVYSACSTEKHPVSPRLAECHEMEAMYAHIEEMLRIIGFLKKEDHNYWMRSIRNFLGRIGLRAKEARLIRGFCRQYLWYEKQK